MITRLKGVLMTLNAIELWWLFITRWIGVVLWVTSLKNKDQSSIISTRIGLVFELRKVYDFE